MHSTETSITLWVLRQSHDGRNWENPQIRWHSSEKNIHLVQTIRRVYLCVISKLFIYAQYPVHTTEWNSTKTFTTNMLLCYDRVGKYHITINISRWESFISSHLAASNSIAAFSTSRTTLSLISHTTSSLSSSSKENSRDSLAKFFSMGSRSRALPLASLQWPSSSSGIGIALSRAARQAARTKSAKLNQNGLESTKLKTTSVALSRPHLHSTLRKHLAGRSQASGAEARDGNEPSSLPCERSKSLWVWGQRNQLELGRRLGVVRVEMYREDERRVSARDRRHSSSPGRRWSRRRPAAMADIPSG